MPTGATPRARASREPVEPRESRESGDVFRAVADPTRRAILDRLRTASVPVNALAADFDMTRPAISKHLRILREADLVSERRDGRERIYQLRPRPLREVASWLEAYRVFWLDGLNNLKQMLEAEEK